MKFRIMTVTAMIAILSAGGVPAAEWESEEILDHSGIGSDCDLEIDSNGKLHICFERQHGSLGNSAIMYGYKAGDLDTWHLTAVDANGGGYTGYDNELTLDNDELPRLVYVWDIDWEYIPYLMYAHFDSDVWHTEQLTDYLEYVDGPTTIAVDRDNYSHLFYGDWYGAGPLHHRWTDEYGWREEEIDSGDCGSPHAVIDEENRIHLVYFNTSQSTVKYGLYDGGEWTLTPVEIDSGVYATSGLDMALDAQGYPHLAYRGSNTEERHAWFDGLAWRIEVVHDYALGYPSIAIDPAGTIHTCYSTYTAASNRPLTYSRRTPDGEWETENVAEDVRCWNTAMAIDPSGRPHIIYYNFDGGITTHTWAATVTGVADPEPANGPLPLAACPNPSSGQSSIAFDLPRAAAVELALYDINGRRVETLANGVLGRGHHVVRTGDLASGIYLIRLRVGNETRSGKLVILSDTR
ncbi:MAG: T9SS type A sorting domain-containing protein [bacterium]|nr:T9SS type A sorting domain-containing protein [bacterium]